MSSALLLGLVPAFAHDCPEPVVEPGPPADYELAEAYGAFRTRGRVLSVVTGVGMAAGTAAGIYVASTPCGPFGCLEHGLLLFSAGEWIVVGGIVTGIHATAGRARLEREGVHVSPVPVVAFWTTTVGSAGLLAAAGVAEAALSGTDVPRDLLIAGGSVGVTSAVFAVVAQAVNDAAFARARRRLRRAD